MHKGVNFTRKAELGDVDGDRVPVVLSSEHPVERDGYVEVLAHDAEAHVDLGRSPLPLLQLHDHRRLPVGVVEDVRLDVGARVLRGWVRFAQSPEGQALKEQVRDRTLRWVSIGYRVLRELSRVGNVLRFAFEPHEVSLVAVPADPGAQFYRSNHTRIYMNDNTNAGPAGGTNPAADRVLQIVDLGRQYAKYLGPNDVADACQGGASVEQFKELIMRKMGSGHTDTRVAHVGMDRSEVQRYSIIRAVNAVLTGDWEKAGLEREASRAVARAFGRSPEGFYVPSDAWARRDFNVGTASEAGNLVATNLRTDLFTDALREQMVLGSLGVKFLPGLSGNVDIPRKSSVGSLGMLTEIGSASETAPATAKVSLTPKRIGAYVEYSKQALIQSALALEGMLRDDLVTGAAVLLEYQALNGSGTAPNMTGIRNTTGIGTVVMGTAGAAPDWASVIALESKAADANAVAGALAGYIVNTKTRGKLKQVQRGTNLDFCWPDAAPDGGGLARLNGYRAGVTNNLPSNLTKGSSTTVCSAGLFSSDWSMAVLAFFGAPDVVVDPYTLAATGQVRITLNQYVDVGVRQPGAFAKVDDWLAG